jgi:pSer/pThr/pTyr-binding forkhead associated (FHA) protein
MDLPTIVVSAVAGIVASGFTAYFTSRSKIAEERQKWEQDFKLKYAEALNLNPESARIIAQQYGIGYLINHSGNAPGSRTFIPPNARITIGRNPNSGIVADGRFVSQTCAIVEADSKNVYLIDLNTRNGTFINGKRMPGGARVQLARRDTIRVGTTEIIFHPYQ